MSRWKIVVAKYLKEIDQAENEHYSLGDDIIHIVIYVRNAKSPMCIIDLDTSLMFVAKKFRVS